MFGLGNNEFGLIWHALIEIAIRLRPVRMAMVRLGENGVREARV